MKWTRHIACIIELRGVYNIFLGKPEAKRLLARCRHREGLIIKWILIK
jgi:hypothetical protein